MVTKTLLTAEELYLLPEPEQGELIRGELIPAMPTSYPHWRLVGRLDRKIGNFVDEHGLGDVGPEGGFVLERGPDTVLAPDVAFVRAGRIPDSARTGFAELPPDLAVEVVSPSNTRADLRRKVAIYLEAGVRLVWVFDSDDRSVAVHAPGREVAVLRIGDVLDGGDVLPGFNLPLADLFA